MSSHKHAQNRSKLNLWVTVAWVVLMAAVVGASLVKVAENRRDLRNQAEWKSRMEVIQAEDREEYERLIDLFRSLYRSAKPPSRSELEAQLNDGRPFDIRLHEGQTESVWTHPKHGFRFALSFDNDVLSGFNTLNRSSVVLPDLPEYAQPKVQRFDSQAEALRKTTRILSITAWLVALIAVACRRHAWLASQVMLAAAISYGAATVVSPAYNLTIRGIFSNDPMFWAALMYLAALIALAKTWPADRLKPQFGIRQLLLVMTATALLMAIGPLGYFALAVFFGGLLMLIGMQTLRMKSP